MTVVGDHDDRTRFEGDLGRARSWHWWGWAMRIVGLILALIGGLALGFEAFGAAVPVRVPPVVSGIVLVFGLLVLSTSQPDDEP